MASLTQTVVRPTNKHDYNGIARVSTKADRANVKLAFESWVANTYKPAVANATTITLISKSQVLTVTANGHPFAKNNTVTIIGVGGINNINENKFIAVDVAANTFVLTTIANTAGTITSNLSSNIVLGSGTTFSSTDVNRNLYATNGNLIGTILTVVSAGNVILSANAVELVSTANFKMSIDSSTYYPYTGQGKVFLTPTGFTFTGLSYT